MKVRWAVAGVHGVLALVHVYWATGVTWPARDQRELSEAVLGQVVSFAPGVVLPLAAFHLVLGAAVLASGRYRVARLAMGGLVAGLGVRALAGLVWVAGVGSEVGPAFYWLNLFVYTPACLVLLVTDLRLLVVGRVKAVVGDSRG